MPFIKSIQRGGGEGGGVWRRRRGLARRWRLRYRSLGSALGMRSGGGGRAHCHSAVARAEDGDEIGECHPEEAVEGVVFGRVPCRRTDLGVLGP